MAVFSCYDCLEFELFNFTSSNHARQTETWKETKKFTGIVAYFTRMGSEDWIIPPVPNWPAWLLPKRKQSPESVQ